MPHRNTKGLSQKGVCSAGCYSLSQSRQYRAIEKKSAQKKPGEQKVPRK